MALCGVIDCPHPFHQPLFVHCADLIEHDLTGFTFESDRDAGGVGEVFGVHTKTRRVQVSPARSAFKNRLVGRRRNMRRIRPAKTALFVFSCEKFSVSLITTDRKSMPKMA